MVSPYSRRGIRQGAPRLSALLAGQHPPCRYFELNFKKRSESNFPVFAPVICICIQSKENSLEEYSTDNDKRIEHQVK
jgi:hypothetical protein